MLLTVWAAYFFHVTRVSFRDGVVSATHLSGQLLKDPLAYHWLLQYPRKTILNHSLHVFEVPAAPR